MAYVKVYAMKKYASRTRSGTLAKKIGYVARDDKTDGGMLVTSYKCSASHAHEEFDHLAAEYDAKRGANSEGGRIAYQVIQSFAPGETDAETAHEIGLKLAMEYTITRTRKRTLSGKRPGSWPRGKRWRA